MKLVKPILFSKVVRDQLKSNRHACTLYVLGRGAGKALTVPGCLSSLPLECYDRRLRTEWWRPGLLACGGIVHADYCKHKQGILHTF